MEKENANHRSTSRRSDPHGALLDAACLRNALRLAEEKSAIAR